MWINIIWPEQLTLDGIGTVLTGLAALAWPVLIAILAFAFRSEAKQLIRRIRSGKFGSLQVDLDKLGDVVQEASAEIDGGAAPSESGAGSIHPKSERVILTEAGQSPRAALLLLTTEIESELRALLGSTGWNDGMRAISLGSGLEAIAKRIKLPGEVAEPLRLFVDLRNRVVHGRNADDEEVLRMVDYGLILLRTLRSIPRETHFVVEPILELFSDKEGQQKIEGVHGVMLRSMKADGSGAIIRVLPSTLDHFRKGQQVAWEWNSNRAFGPAWFKDPETGEFKQNWTQSSEFVGRDIREV